MKHPEYAKPEIVLIANALTAIVHSTRKGFRFIEISPELPPAESAPSYEADD